MNYSGFEHEFSTDGYTIVRNVVPQDEITRLRALFESMNKGDNSYSFPLNRERMHTHLFDNFPELQKYMFSGVVQLVLSKLLGKTIWCLPESLLHCNRYFDWHKDSTVMDNHAIDYHLKTNATIVQMGLYFQDNSSSGGGLFLTKGSHRSPDRFAQPKQANSVQRLFGHFFGNSLNKRIEREDAPIAPDIKAGDVILFDYRLDHRASFQRNWWGKPKRLKAQKYAVFSQFTNDEKLLRYYLKAIRKNPGPYSNFLETYKLPQSLKTLLDSNSIKTVLE